MNNKMGSYKEIEGNLLDMFDKGDFGAIAHGANCENIMGAGIAGQIAERYPEAYFADKFCPIPKGIWRLGKLSYTENEDIFNLYTQVNPGRNAELEAVSMSLRLMASILDPSVTIGLPLIGCGIGGLFWQDVKRIIQIELRDFNVTIVHFKK